MPRSSSLFRSRFFLPILIYLALAAAFLIWALQPQRGVDLRAEIQADRLGFSTRTGTNLFNNLELQYLAIQPFSQAAVPADSMFEEREGQILGTVLDGGIRLAPIAGFGSADMRLENVSILELLLRERAGIYLSAPTANEVQIDLNQQDGTVLKLSGADELRLEANQVVLLDFAEEARQEYFSDPLIASFAGVNRELTVRSEDEHVSLYLGYDAGKHLEIGPFKVNSLDLTKKEGRERVSSLLGASFAYMNGVDAYKEFDLTAGESLELDMLEPLELLSLQHTPTGFVCHVSGRVDYVRTGPDGQIQNPHRLEWLWINRRLPLLLSFVLLTGIIFFLPESIREKVMNFLEWILRFKP